jgi:hypothetical protein
MTAWGTPAEIERRRRIRVAVWAYAYEVLDVSLVCDHRFDAECKLIDPTVLTGKPRLDQWFAKEFAAHTGQWVHKHPDLKHLAALTLAIISTNPKVLE